MKTFKQLFYAEAAAAPAQDYKVKKASDEDEQYKPRSKGEEDFANMHTVDTGPHPVASDAQHKGSTKKGDPKQHVGGRKHAMGENADYITRRELSTFIGSK
jgi:hypothetical protein